MLTIKDLVIKNIQQNLTLVDNLSFVLNENDKIAIIGSEGSGKSTLLKVIKGNKEEYIFYSGEIIRPKIISYLEQNISISHKDKTVIEYLEEEILKSYRYDLYQTLPKLASFFNLEFSEIENRKIKTFSGGEKIKIGLMKALMIEPDLLLLDEPSNDLDFDSLIFLESFLKETSIPVLFVSHDQRLLENVSNGIIHLQHIYRKTEAKTSFVKLGYKEFKQQYSRTFDHQMMVAKKQRSDHDKRMEKFNQIYEKVHNKQNQAIKDPSLGRLLKKKIKTLKSQERRFLKDKEEFLSIPEQEESMYLFFEKSNRVNSQKIILDLKLKALKIPNGKVIENINLSVKGKDKIAIIGNNGIGKTTLMKVIEENFKNNQINYSYISQNYDDVLNYDEVLLNFLLEKQNKYNETRIRQILATLGFKKDEMLYQIKDLSEGSKLKALLFLMVSVENLVLLLDEPTRNISPLNQDKLYELFNNYEGAIIAVTHDRSFIEEVFDDVYTLNEEGLIKEI